MDIKIGEQKEPMTDDEIYLYIMTKFADAREQNARIEREQREKQRMSKLESKQQDNQISSVVIFIVLIIAIIVCAC